MENLKAEELKSDLRDLVETRLDAVQNKNVRIVFFKENDEWCANGICLQKDNTISERDIKTLKWIKSVDNQAVVMGKRDFMKDWKDELISLDEAVYTIEYRHGNVNCHNNISKFLEKCEEEENNIKMMKESYKQWAEGNSDIALQKLQQQPTTLKFDKEKFLQSEMGSMLCSQMNKLTTEIAIIEALLSALKQCYDVNYYIAFHNGKCGIFSPDTKEWLFE